ETELPFRVVSRITGSNPVVTPTGHPLVALVSVPACPQGSHFRVGMQREQDSDVTYTGEEMCRGNRSSNMYVAGMRADSAYRLRPEILKNGAVQAGAWL